VTDQEFIALLSRLDKACENCGGSGEVGATDHLRDECPICQGSGRKLTSAGEAFMAFIRAHLVASDIRDLD
jgi:DnaJ-class molecular chaperone